MANNYALLLTTGVLQPVTIAPGEYQVAFDFLGQSLGQYGFTVEGEPINYITRQDIIAWSPYQDFSGDPTEALLDNNIPFDPAFWGRTFVDYALANPWVPGDAPVMQAWFQKAYARGVAGT